MRSRSLPNCKVWTGRALVYPPHTALIASFGSFRVAQPSSEDPHVGTVAPQRVLSSESQREPRGRAVTVNPVITDQTLDKICPGQ